MTDNVTLIAGGTVVTDGRELRHDVLVRGGSIAAVGEGLSADGATVVDATGRSVIPGYIDLHVHGAMGRGFGAVAAEDYRSLARTLAGAGVTAALATLASPTPEEMMASLDLLADEQESAEGGARLLGAHFEGPYLSPLERGAHPTESLRVPTRDDTALLLSKSGLRMITIAPELPGALDMIAALSAAGTVVSIGHTSASTDEVRAAQRAGARHFTHLWSGMNSVHRKGPWRHAGVVESALASTGMTAEVIGDGRHLPAALMTVAWRCFGDDLCLVSDATEGAGLPEGTSFGPESHRARIENSVVVMEDGASFGGSATLLDGVIRHVVLELGWPLAASVRMATSVPASIIGDTARGSIAVGRRADIVLLDDELAPTATMIGGRWVVGYETPGTDA